MTTIAFRRYLATYVAGDTAVHCLAIALGGENYRVAKDSGECAVAVLTALGYGSILADDREVDAAEATLSRLAPTFAGAIDAFRADPTQEFEVAHFTTATSGPDYAAVMALHHRPDRAILLGRPRGALQ